MGRNRSGSGPLTDTSESAVVDAGGFRIQCDVSETSSHFFLALTLASGSIGGSNRLSLLLKRLFEYDHVLPSVVARNGRVEISISRDANQNHQRRAFEILLPLLLPPKVEDSLYSYQRQGVAWLLTHEKGILADDMGLGKTAQALGAVRRLVRHGKASWGVVVAPKTLIENWRYETEKWAPELAVEILMPANSSRSISWQRAAHSSHLSITSYDHLRVAVDAIANTRPDFVIADEAHKLRNEDSETSLAFRAFESRRLWLLTGTPVENRPEDLAVLLSILDPRKYSAEDSKKGIASLRSVARPFVMRRHKNDVLTELPPVVETNEILVLTPEQKQSYEMLVTSHLRSRDTDYLTLFNKLRSICDYDPGTAQSSKIDRIVELVQSIRANGRKVVVFSYLIDPLILLEKRLQSEGIRVSKLIGSMSSGERESAINDFKSDSNVTALLASMRIASEGLTLTEANHVVFLNQWWNPSANNQARDRVVRIGQLQPVEVTTFTCKGTVEERLPKLLKEKSLTFDSLVEQLAINASLLFGLQ